MGGFSYRSASGTSFQFQKGLDNPDHSEGLLFYDENHKTLAQYNQETGVIHQIGRELHDRIFNNTGSIIPNGSIVYISGAEQELHTNALGMADNPATTKVFGVATHDIENNSTGYATSFGLVHNFDTSAWIPGTILFLSESSPGALTSTRPSPPNFPIRVATVTVQDANVGTIFVETGPVDVTDHMVIQQLSINNDLTLPKSSGVGIRIDVADPSFGWHDILGNVTQLNTGGSKPTFEIYQGALRQFQFAAGKEEYFEYHIPHDHLPGSDIFLHIHWSHTGTLVTGGSVTFEYELSYSKSHNQQAFGTPITGNLVGSASSTQYQQVLSETQVSENTPSGSQIDSDDLEPDGLVLTRLKVLSNDIEVSGGGAPDPFIHYVDLHYQSTNIATKQKSPNFYT